MISTTKRGLSMILLLCTVFMTMAGYCRTASAAMNYNNAITTDVIASFDSSGRIHAVLSVEGINGTTTNIEADLYVEKRIMGVFWKKVDIGCTNNVWHDATTSYNYSNEFISPVLSSGTYRVNVTFTVSGSGGSPDVIQKTRTVSH